MADIQDVIKVNIDLRGVTNIKSEKFDLLLMLGTSKVFLDRYRTYYNANELLEDGFREDSAEYIAASRIFEFSPCVDHIYVGRRQADSVTLKINTVVVNTNYYVKINTNTYAFNSGSSPTNLTIAAGLVAAMAADPLVNVVNNLDGTYTLTAKVALTPYTTLIDSNQVFQTMTPSETILESVQAINALVNDWFAIIETSRVKNDVLSLAQWCENEHKLFVTVSNESDIINSAVETTSVAAVLRAAKYRFVACLYHASLTDFIDAAWMGEELRKIPGSSTWSLKQLPSITPDNLTKTQGNNALAKQCNTFELIGGVGVIRDGKVCDDKYIYIDVVRDLEYMKVDIEVKLFQFLIDTDKVPYTDAGIAMFQGKVQNRLHNAVTLGILASTPAPTTSVPLAKDVPVEDKQARILREVKYWGTLANAIHKAEIDGTINY